MTLARLLETVKQRGLQLRLGDDGSPRLVGPKGAATPALVEALKAFRQEVIKALSPPPFRPRLWLWRFGQTYHEHRGDGGPDWHPTGAWWWKLEGETAWRQVPGREEWARNYDPPEV